MRGMRKICCIALLLLLSACAVTRSVELGVPMRPAQIAAVQGAGTRAEVFEALGSPAAVSLGNDRWFYFRAEGRRFAFLHPRFRKYRIVEVEFAPDDTVREVAVRDIRDANFRTDSRRTRHESERFDFFGELFGHVGMFQMAGVGVTPASPD